jgi:hypothetical protein
MVNTMVMGISPMADTFSTVNQDVFRYIFSWSLDINLENESIYEINEEWKKIELDKSNIEKNKENIKQIANKWWQYGFYDYPENTIYKDLYITNPKIEYITMYRYIDWKNKQYLVPCIVFDVEKSDQLNYTQEKIIVPLYKEFYKYDDKWNIIWSKD